MNRFRFVFLFVSVFALLASVSSAQTLEVVLQGFGGARHVLEEELVPEFEAMYPGVKVEISYRGWSGYIDFYVSRHMAGMAPDILTLGSEVMGSFAQQGMLLNLDPFLAEWDGFDDVVPSTWHGVTYEGSVYALPFKLGVRTLTYRADIFEEVGLPGHIPPTTWDELREYARRLAKRDAEGNLVRHGFTVQSDWKFIIPFLYQAGLDVWRHDNTTDLNSPAGIEALEFLQSIVYEDRSATIYNGNLMNAFTSGTTAMMWATSTVMSIALGESSLPPEALGVALPLTGRVQSTQMHLDRFAISSQTQHPELAWAWLEFIMRPENQSRLAQATMFLAPSIGTIQLPPFRDDPRWLTWLESALIARSVPDYVPTWEEMLTQLLQPMLHDVMQNNSPVPAALEDLERRIQAQFGR